jgi:hypothetical protein
MLERVEFVFRTARPSGIRDVLGCLAAISREREPSFPNFLTPDYLQFLIAVTGTMDRLGGARAHEINQRLAQVLSQLGDASANFPLYTAEFTRFIEAVARGAGNRAPEALLCVIPGIRHSLLSERAGERIGRWIGDYLSGSRGAGLDARMAQLTEFFGSATPEMVDLLLDRPRQYRRGLELARSLIGPGATLTEAVNFAIGIQRIGEERVTLLYRTFGTRFFNRYSDTMLGRMTALARGERPTRPTAFVVFPHSDYNGAFYQQGRLLDQLLPHFDVVVFERGDEAGVYQAAAEHRRRYGRIGTIILAGHGTPEWVTLGPDTETGRIDLTDREELRRLRPLVTDSPQVILISCSTGANDGSIGAVMSTALGAILSAPRVPAGVLEYRVHNGVISPVYTRESGLFVAGRDLRERPQE